MVPDSFHDRWDGPHWRWWSLLAGIAASGLTLAIAAAVSAVLAESTRPLAFLFMTVLLLGISTVGSGMFDGLAARAISGGLARQPADDERAQRPVPSEEDRDRRDRRTVRCGLAALPALAAFVALLLS